MSNTAHLSSADPLSPIAWKHVAAEDAFGTTIFIWALDHFGYDDDGYYLLRWDPDTIWLECRDALHRPLPPANYNRLMAVVSLINTDIPWKDAQAFVHVANILCGSDAASGTFDPAEPEECAWAVTEMMLLSPPKSGESEFGPEVRAYVKAALREFGFVKPPASLAFLVDATELSSSFPVDTSAEDSATLAAQYGRTDEVDAEVRESLAKLLKQVETLSLKSADPVSVRNMLVKEVQAARRALASSAD